MSFLTAQEMFDALSEQIPDEDFVMRAVRTAFPAWKKDQVAIRLTPLLHAAKPKEYAENADELRTRRSITDGSRQLLKALHREHPIAMKALAAQGRQVVFL